MTDVDAPAAPRPAPPFQVPQPPGGERMVVYHWCLSLLIVSYKRVSAIKVIPPGGGRIRPGLPYSLLSFIAGWWGIPWGPIWTIEAIIKNFRGGTDVTDAVYGQAVIHAAAAAHFAEAARAAEAAPVTTPDPTSMAAESDRPIEADEPGADAS